MAPCELWDLPRRQLIKTLPNKLPPITTACWKEAVEGVKYVKLLNIPALKHNRSMNDTISSSINVRFNL